MKGCFGVSTLRELSILPPRVRTILAENQEKLRSAVQKNLESAEGRAVSASVLTDLVLTFNTGLCSEVGAGLSAEAKERKIREFLQLARGGRPV
jgi:hypothetical protein